MSKKISLAFGAYYHITQRGNNREDIFVEARNYPYFMKLYSKYIDPIADTFAYCLLKNHVHFLVRIKTLRVLETLRVSVRDPSRQFGNLFNAYAKAFNKAYNRTGSLFQNPFGRVEVRSDEQLIHLVSYIHRNPQRHGLVEDFRDWPYSSYIEMLHEGPAQVQRGEVIDWFGDRHVFVNHHLDAPNRQVLEAFTQGDGFK
jgi:putative transposase